MKRLLQKCCFGNKVLARRVSSRPMDAHFWKKYKKNSFKLSYHVKGKHAFWTAVFNVWLKAVWEPQHGHPNRDRP